VSDVGEDATRFVVLNVVHTARDNNNADAKAGLQHLLDHALLGGESGTWVRVAQHWAGANWGGVSHTSPGSGSDRGLY
jgi:hypothetical protein